MLPTQEVMKLSEIDKNIGDRETIIDPQYKKIDKYGRLQVGLDFANQEVFVLYLRPKEGDKEKWIKVGRS